MSDSHDNPQTAGNDASTILLIAAMVLLFSIIPPALLLLRLWIVHPEYFRRSVTREEHLPITEQPTNNWADLNKFFRRAQEVVLNLPASASAAGGAIALRSREACEKFRGRKSGPFDDRGHRCSYLPVMRNKSWQLLAESHTELTFSRFKDDKVEHETIEVVEIPKKTTKIVRFDLGDEDNKDPCVRKPEPAVVAGVKTRSRED